MSVRMADHLGQLLADAGDHDHRLWVLDGDLADSDGAIHFAARHPDRFLMAGIAEQNMVSVAAGMAHGGLRPWVFSFAAFLCYRAYDQIRVCLSQAKQPVVLVGSHAGGALGRNGKTHSAMNDLALLLSLPGLHVWSPGDFADIAFAMQSIAVQPAPTYVRLPRRPLAPEEILPGTAAPSRWLRERRPITLVATGIASRWALAAADCLAARGLQVGLLHCLSLSPLPPLAQQLAGVEQLFVIEDHYAFGGLASLLQQLQLAAPITAFGWPDHWSGNSGSDEELLAHHGLSGAALADSILNKLARPRAASTRG